MRENNKIYCSGILEQGKPPTLNKNGILNACLAFGNMAINSKCCLGTSFLYSLNNRPNVCNISYAKRYNPFKMCPELLYFRFLFLKKTTKNWFYAGRPIN